MSCYPERLLQAQGSGGWRPRWSAWGLFGVLVSPPATFPVRAVSGHADAQPRASPPDPAHCSPLLLGAWPHVPIGSSAD